MSPAPPAPREPGGPAALRRAATGILAALLFRLVCYAAMTALAIQGELRPAPTLPDLVLDRLPYVAWVARANTWLWLLAYLPLSAVLLWQEPRRWIRYMVTGGLVSLARGVCIVLTGLGPPDPARTGAGLGGRSALDAWLALLSPVEVFGRGALGLTQDLFFSGHTATTFLLLLYLWRRPRLRLLALAAHVAVVASVLLARLHYSIDVVGAWAVTFALYAAREWRPHPE